MKLRKGNSHIDYGEANPRYSCPFKLIFVNCTTINQSEALNKQANLPICLSFYILDVINFFLRFYLYIAVCKMSASSCFLACETAQALKHTNRPEIAVNCSNVPNLKGTVRVKQTLYFVPDVMYCSSLREARSHERSSSELLKAVACYDRRISSHAKRIVEFGVEFRRHYLNVT